MLKRWLLIGLVALCPTIAAAQDAKTSVKVAPWNALPASTFAAVEFNDLQGLLNELRSKTKLGAVVLTDARFQSFMNLMKSEAGNDWEEMTAELGKLGLSPDDLMSLAKGSGGVAFNLNPRDAGMDPLISMMMWVKCSPEQQQRFVTAIDRGLEQARANGEEMQRVDSQMAGFPVMRISSLVKRTDYSVEPDGDGNYPTYAADQQNMFLARTPYGFVATMNMPAERSMIRKMRQAGEIDVAKVSGAATLEREFGRMLSLLPSGDSEGFAIKSSQVKGMSTLRPAGRPIFRAVAMPQRAIQMAMQSGDPEMVQGFQALSIDKVGAAALFMSLDGEILRTKGFLESNGPKSGIFKLLDQPKSAFKVPDWVPASAVGYSSFGLDLLGVFNTIKEIGSKIDPMFEQQIAQADGMAAGFLGSNIATILGAVAKTHSVINFEPKAPANVPAEFAADVPMDRLAFAIPLVDMGPWMKLFNQIQPMLAGGGDGMELFNDERGFSGMRVSEPLEAGLYIGQGHLMIAIGEGVGVEVSSALVKAPEGDQAFKNHPVIAQAQKIISFREGIAHQVSDNDRYVKGLMQQLKTIMGMASGDQGFTNKVMAVFPTATEMQGVLGVSGSQVYVDGNGFILESNQALGGK